MDSPDLSEEFIYPGDISENTLGWNILFDKHPNPLLIFSKIDHRFLAVNEAAMEKYGYSREEFLSLSVVDIRPEEDKADFLKLVAQDHPALRSVGLWRHLRKNGDLMYVDVTSQAILWYGEPARIFSINDVTEHKRIEHRLLESEKLYRHVIENAGDFIYTTDINGYFVEVNEAALKVSGYTLDELQGYRYLDLIAPDYRKKIMLQYVRQFLKRENSLYVEFPFVIKNGDIKWFGQYSALIYKDGEPMGFHVIGYDITSRKIAEEELNKANIALEKKVHERTAELEGILERLKGALEREKELNELKTRFVTMISHEFRTPLTGILSNTEILERYGDKISEEQRKKMFGAIIDSIHHMTHLLEDVLDVSKATEAKLSVTPVPFNIRAFFEEIIAQAHLANIERQFVFSASGENMNVLCDRKLLRLIVTNLISNALKYSPKTTPIKIILVVESSHIYFTVTDHGIGMGQEDLQHLYEPFYRSKHVETITGTGLGLSIVKQSVERHNGRISVQSEVGKGTRFTVEIPAETLSA
jgi:PAS domain S-box-containing protein